MRSSHIFPLVAPSLQKYILLRIWEISGSQGGDSEYNYLVGYDGVELGTYICFVRSADASILKMAGSRFLLNVDPCIPRYTTSYLR
jgi:hypothetical protein